MLRAEFTSWIFQIGLSWMKDSGQHCLLERTVRQNLLPRHMNAIHSIKAVWTLIFKHTFKLSHLIATVSQVTFYVTRSIHCGLKICQPKSIRLVDLTSTVTDYLAQNLNWKTGSLTSCLYFNKKQSSARFIPTCDKVKKPPQTLNHDSVSLASHCQSRPHFLPTWVWIHSLVGSGIIQNKSWFSSNHT